MKPQIVNSKMNRFVIKSRIVKAAIFIMSVLMVAVMTGSLYFRERVYIIDNGVTKELMTSEEDVYAILKFGGYTLNPNDRVSYEQGDANTAYITIYRAFDVKVNADGETYAVSMLEGTAAQALARAGVTLGEEDTADISLSENVKEGMVINVSRVTYELKQTTEELPFETEYRDNSNMAIGSEKVVVEGEPGEISNFVRLKYVDGVLSGSSPVLETVTKQPVTQIVERGTALAVPYAEMADPEALTLVNGIPESYTRVVSGKSTAYTAYRGARTASGRYAEIGTVAVNPNVIPYGSELYIVSQDGRKVYGYAIAADTGLGLMDGTVAVDLYFGNMDEHYYDSCNWGAVMVDIYVLSEGYGY